MIDMNYLQKLEEYIVSGAVKEDFENSPEERRLEILDFLEKIMDVAEQADKAATEIIFKNSQLGMLMGDNPHK